MIGKHTLAVLAAATFTMFAAGAAFDHADARERRASGSVQTQRGTYTGQAQTNREPGSRSRSATVTGPNGGQRNVQDNRTWGDGAYSHDRSVTGAGGRTRTVDTDAVSNGDGTGSFTRSVTGRNGETRTQSGDVAVTRTENGRNVSGTINTSNAGTIDYNRDVTHENGVRSVNSTATFEDGTSVSRASSSSCANGACSSSGTVTNRAGGVTSWDQTRARTETGAVVDRSVTYPDGTSRTINRERIGNGDGTGTINRTATDRAGQTHTQTGEYVVTTTP